MYSSNGFHMDSGIWPENKFGFRSRPTGQEGPWVLNSWHPFLFSDMGKLETMPKREKNNE